MCFIIHYFDYEHETGLCILQHFEVYFFFDIFVSYIKNDKFYFWGMKKAGLSSD